MKSVSTFSVIDFETAQGARNSICQIGFVTVEIGIIEYSGHCTYKIYREALGSLCEKYRIELDHHNALSDAHACAKLFMLHQK